MHLRHALAFLFILAVSVPGAMGQGSRGATSSTTTLSGTVRDDTNQVGLEAVRVDLKRVTGVPVSTTFTRGNGEFEFMGVGNGEYTIEVSLTGYEDYRESFAVLPGSRKNVSVFLRPPVMVTNKAAGGPMISAHQLSAPRKAREEYEKGLALLYGKSDFRGAVTRFERAIKAFPDYFEAYAQQGSAQVGMGDIAAGEQFMRKSIEMSAGKYPEAFHMLAALLNNVERYSEAETIARQGVAADPYSWRGHHELARALVGLKQPDEAEKAAIQSRDFKPDNPPVYLLLANAHIQKRDYPALLKDLDGYLKLVPAGPEADQARKTRDQLQEALKKQGEQSSAQPPQP